MKLSSSFAVVTLLVIMLSPTAYSDVVISSESIELIPGSLASVDFFAADPDGTGNLTGFNLPFDFGVGTDGDSIPSELSFAAPFITNAFSASVSYTPFSGTGLNVDGSVNAFDGAGIAISATPTRIFTLNFDVASTASEGDIFDLTIIDELTGPPTAVSGSDLGTPTYNSPAGQIEIAAVPEPTGTLALIACGLGLAARRRR